ncbi:DUF1310 family protein [Gemella haemolysans]|uniref:DUF1310 family protein n=2 Tax=Gemella haemolysans TaxID=1379 RepID=C5NV23_9BACL|nr:DUF1310 family protein [Gemella haemolysans]EER68868.1 hypothetical protein GEMHA0001_1400 [Gemella haemolysans ATCC 10379]KAA8707964.1 DUF1310 family protein [Gemella haemolysans]UBH81940.1 DUF1310 domain-containing protein [Gemella haemolysans]VEI38145.1 Protein of uncharacterised function (DUF1310) [Gemella haemolysans]
MKKILIGILSTVAIIAILIGGKIQMDKYRVKSIVHSEEAKVAIKRIFKNRDDKAFTSEGKIKSYRLDEGKIKKNPMGGVDISIIVNDDKDMILNTTISQDKYNGGYKTEGMSISPKLDEIMYSEDKEKE